MYFEPLLLIKKVKNSKAPRTNKANNFMDEDIL
jgi:hypothetical protein